MEWLPLHWPVLVFTTRANASYLYPMEQRKLAPSTAEQVYEQDLMKGSQGRRSKKMRSYASRLTQSFSMISSLERRMSSVVKLQRIQLVATSLQTPRIALDTNSLTVLLLSKSKAGIFDQVDDQFPFDIKPYRYLLFRNSRDSSGSLLSR